MNSVSTLGRSVRLTELASRYQLVLFIALALIRGFVFTLVIPPWQHPDEPTHFEHIRMVAESGRLPATTDVSLPIRKEIASSMYLYKFWVGIKEPSLDDQSLSTIGTSPLGVYTLTQPRLYYIIAASWVYPWLSQSVEVQLYAVRMLSVVLSIIVLISGYTVARLYWTNSLWATTVCTLIVFMPGYTDIMSAVNNDSLVNAFAACFLLNIALIIRWRKRRYIGVPLLLVSVGILVAAMASKATALGLVVALPLLWLAIGTVWAILIDKDHLGWRILVLFTVSLVSVAGLILVGVVLGSDRQQFVRALDWLSQYVRADLNGTIGNILGQGSQKVSYELASEIVFKSFWAIFGWRHVYIGSGWYSLPATLTIGALCALVWQLIRKFCRNRNNVISEVQTSKVLLLTGSLVIFASAWIMAIIRSQAEQGMTSYQSHGRYAYIALIPFALLLTQGVIGPVKVPWQRRAVILFGIGIIAFDALCFWGFLFPYYYT